MLCEQCGKKPATVHLTRIVNGQKQESHLCEACARERGEVHIMGEPYFSINQLLAGLMNHDVVSPVTRPREEPCPNCGLSYGDFARLGRLGCDVCYSHFESRLDPLLKRIHAASTHSGKVPHKAGATAHLRRELDRLREDLNKAVFEEQYEKAAVIRDQIRELENQMK